MRRHRRWLGFSFSVRAHPLTCFRRGREISPSVRNPPAHRGNYMHGQYRKVMVGYKAHGRFGRQYAVGMTKVSRPDMARWSSGRTHPRALPDDGLETRFDGGDRALRSARLALDKVDAVFTAKLCVGRPARLALDVF